MKRTKLFLMSLVAVGITLTFGMHFARAQQFHSGKNITLQTQPIHHTVYVAGQTIEINTEVFGDVYCAGQNVNITGTVHGDVMCAGQNVNIRGNVLGDVRLVGQTVTLSANVSNNATIGGQTFVLDSAGKIAGDATVGSSTATLNGGIGRDLVIGGETVTVNSSIGRNITAGTTHLNLGPSTRVTGDISYTSHNELAKDQAAKITGLVKRHEPPQDAKKSKHWSVFGFGLVWFVYLLVSMLIVALVLAMVAPNTLKTTTDFAFPAPWRSLLVGFLAGIIVPAVIIMMMVTVIGIPLGIMALLGWLLIYSLSGPFVAYYLGRRLLPNTNRPTVTMLAGGTLLIVLYFIPIVGFIFLLAAGWTGTGMILQSLYTYHKKTNRRLTPKSTAKS